MDIIEAACTNNLYAMKRYLENGVSPNVFIDDAKVTPLHQAVVRDDLEMIKLLLTYGADPNQADGDGHTPLSIATESEKIEMILLMLAAMNEDA